jgi:molybdopterin-synthase adenylyltransferase
MAVFPNESACLRCVIESPPDPGTTETCDTAGVIAPAVHMVTALQAATALKILSGQRNLVEPKLTIVDVWDGTLRQMNVGGLRARGECPACGRQRRRDWLHGGQTSQSTILCGRNSVQISPAERANLSLEDVAAKLSPLGDVTRNPFLLRFQPAGEVIQLTVFRDGRAIVQGTEDPAIARSVYARYVGG